MLPVNIIGLLLLPFFLLLSANEKPVQPKHKISRKSTRFHTQLKTNFNFLNKTWPIIEDDFSSINKEILDLSPIGVNGHHILTGVKTICPESSAEELLSRLGTAFNVRYMSVERPSYRPESHVKREPAYQQDQQFSDRGYEQPDFYVDSDFVRELGESEEYRRRAAKRNATQWFFRRFRRFAKSRNKKATRRVPSQDHLPWKCPMSVVWRDLGNDHFPQFLRSVRCLSENCWFSHFRCLPKAFTVKVLKRKSDACVPIPSSGTTESRYEQYWVFEERAVTFCCECVDY